MGSGSSERVVVLRNGVFYCGEESRSRLRVCWKCGNLRYCPHCKKVECSLGRPVGKAICAFREGVDVG
jgi:hypothetical protein